MINVETNILNSRINKYKNIKINLNQKKINYKDFKFFIEIDLKKAELLKIRKLISIYILKNINIFFKKKFKKLKNLKSKESYLLKLPNITPNGVIKLKKETINEFKDIQMEVLKIFEKKNIKKNINLMEYAEIRLMRSNKHDYNSKRPYSSSKIHSDSWSGNPCDSKTAMFILGDRKNTIQFYSPKKIDSNFFKKKINYERTIKKYGFKKIKKLNTKCITIFDQSCLHKTVNYNKGLRISLDFGIIISKSININKFTNRYKNNFFNPNKKNNFSALFDKKKIKSIFSKSYY